MKVNFGCFFLTVLMGLLENLKMTHVACIQQSQELAHASSAESVVCISSHLCV